MIEVIPFGLIDQELFQKSKESKLIEQIAGIWRFTDKAKDNYDILSLMRFLQKKIDKPIRVKDSKPLKTPHKVKKQAKKQQEKVEKPLSERDKVIQSILLL